MAAKATEQSALKLLFPAATPVPPLVQDKQFDDRLKEHIWNLVALICREYVLIFYQRLTKDRTFFQEVTRIVSHVVARLEEHVKDLDLPALLLADIPKLLEKHCKDYRTAEERAGTPAGGLLSLSELFHSVHPHIAIRPASTCKVDPKLPLVSAPYMIAMVEGILEAVLPLEDYAAESERTIIREVLIYVVCGNLFTKLSQPWFIHTILIKLLATDPDHVTVPESTASPPPSLFARVTSTLSKAISLLSSFSPFSSTPSGPDLTAAAIQLGATIFRAEERPIVRQGLWFSEIMSDIFSGSIDRYGFCSSLCFGSDFESSLIRQLFTSHLNPANLSKILSIAEHTLFPDGHPAPSVPGPSIEDQALLKEQAETLLAARIPQQLVDMLLLDEPRDKRRLVIAKDILDPLGTWECNVVLVLEVLELVICRLIPELTFVGNKKRLAGVM